MSTVKNITEGNVYKNYLQYAAPLIFSSLLSSLYSTVDAVIAGKFIGEYAMGAISATSSFDDLFRSFFTGFACGFSVYIAQLFGRKNYGAVKRNAVSMIVFISGVSFLASFLAILFRGPILDYMNIDPVLRRDSEIYFVIYTASYLFTYVNMILLRTLYALGITSFSLLTSIVSAVINVGGNLVAVLVLDWGVAGLACSTFLSILAMTVIYGYLLVKVFRELKCEKVSYRFRFATIRESLSLTLPAAIQKMAFFATGIFYAPALNGLGAAATTGYSVMNKLYNFCAQSFWNMCSAVDCHTAQAAGEGNVQKVRHGLKAGLWMNLAVMTPFVLLFSVFAKPLASVFFPKGYEGLALEYTVRFFKVYAVFLYANMMGHLMHSYMRSIGQVKTVLWVTLFGSSVRVIATLLLVPVLGMDGVYQGLVLSWVADGALSVIFYFVRCHSKQKLCRIISRQRSC